MSKSLENCEGPHRKCSPLALPPSVAHADADWWRVLRPPLLPGPLREAQRGDPGERDDSRDRHEDRRPPRELDEAGAPALKGPMFTSRWNDQPLSEMFLTIGATMPQNRPDTLTPQTVGDIVAFLLQSNSMPAGPNELEPTIDSLKQIWLQKQ